MSFIKVYISSTGNYNLWTTRPSPTMYHNFCPGSGPHKKNEPYIVLVALLCIIFSDSKGRASRNQAVCPAGSEPKFWSLVIFIGMPDSLNPSQQHLQLNCMPLQMPCSVTMMNWKGDELPSSSTLCRRGTGAVGALLTCSALMVGGAS